MKRKLLAVVLSLCLVMGMLPVTAMAAEGVACPDGDTCIHEASIGGMHYSTLKEAVEAAPGDYEGTEITLLKSVTLSEKLTIDSKSITLNMQAFNITGPSAGVIEVIDGSLNITGSGTISNAQSDAAGNVIILSGADSCLNLNSGTMNPQGTVEIVDKTTGGAAVSVSGSSGAMLYEGSIGSEKGAAFQVAGGYVMIYGGTVAAQNAVSIPDGAAGVEIFFSAGRIISSDDTIIGKENASIDIYEEVKFNKNDLSDSCGEGYTMVEEDGWWVARPLPKVRVDIPGVGTYNLASLADAVSLAGNGATITLLDDLTIYATLPIQDSVTLDLAGHTIKGPAYDSNFDYSPMLSVSSDGNLTLIGTGGTLDYNDEYVSAETESCLFVAEGGTCSITGVNFHNSGYAIMNSGTITEIVGCTATSDDISIGTRGEIKKIADTTIDAGTTALSIVDGTGIVGELSGGNTFTSQGSTINCEGEIIIKGGTYINNFPDLPRSAFILSGGNAVISGGTFTGTGAAACAEDGTLTITGGTFTGGDGKEALEIDDWGIAPIIQVSAGSFSTKVPEEFCADDYVPTVTTGADGMFTVVEDAEGAVTGLELSAASVDLYVGGSAKVTATVTTASGTVTPVWTSSDPNVAAVDQNGNVTARSVGTATITVKAGGMEKTCQVAVSVPYAPVPPIVPVSPVKPQPEPDIPAPGYADVGANDWYCDEVAYVTARGLMTGTAPTTFTPNAPTTRAMVWTILGRMGGARVDGGEPWYALAQAWAKVEGVSDGTDPDGQITREQLAVMLYRYAAYRGMEAVTLEENLISFADGDQVSGFAIQAMNWAVGRGIVSGFEDNTLRPQGRATRAEVAAMLMRFCLLAGK